MTTTARDKRLLNALITEPPRKPAARKKTALMTGASVDRFGVVATQVLVAALWLTGLFGSMLAFIPGQLAGFLADPAALTVRTFCYGLAIQAGLTAFEWTNRHRKRHLYWLVPFAIDAGLTYAGYRAYLGPQVAGMLVAAGMSAISAYWLAQAIVVGGALTAAWLPENRFVD